MRLSIELPDAGVTAGATLYESSAPGVIRWLGSALVTPFEGRTQHACFDGHEVFCLLPGEGDVPLENRTMRPRPGEIMFFHSPPNSFAALGDDRLTGGSSAVYELAFMYGEVDLRHYWEEGMHGSLIGRIDEGFDEFAAACERTLSHGAERIVVRGV